MASLLVPFSGFIPSSDYGNRIVGPPSSMLSPEQREAASHDEMSFRHSVGRGADASRKQARKWLKRCLSSGALHEIHEAVIVHRSTHQGLTATGLIADVSLDAYDAGQVKRHENTIAKTERKMVDYMATTRIFGNPVALAHRDHAEVATSLSTHSETAADVAFDTIDGAHHELWIVDGPDAIELCELLDDVLYITDGHHRLAGGSALASVEEHVQPRVPAGVFAESELHVWAFARVIDDDTINASDLLATLDSRFDLETSPSAVTRPTRPHQMGLRVDGQSFILSIPDSVIPTDLHAQLDVTLLQDLILGPLLGVTDPRSDPRLRFVADTSDEAHVPDASAVWFLPYPSSVTDVMAVADAGQVMPPKSTYFLPKLPSGLVIRPIDRP